MDTRGKDAQLAPVPRLRQGNVAHVVLQLEIRILDPVGVIELERNARQAAADVTLGDYRLQEAKIKHGAIRPAG